MRKYQEIWEKLKKESHVTLDFPRSSHNTLLKGLKKNQLRIQHTDSDALTKDAVIV